MMLSPIPPRMHGAGMIGDVLNLIGDKIPSRFVVSVALLLIGFFATYHLLKIQRDVAQLGEHTAEAKKLELEAEGLTQKIRGRQAAVEKKRQDIAKLDNQAAIARQEADALKQKINGVSAAQAALEAEISDMENKQRTLAADLTAKSQMTTDNIPLATAQKRADISVAQAEIHKTLQMLCLLRPIFMEGPFYNSWNVLMHTSSQINDGMPCPGLDKGWTP